MGEGKSLNMLARAFLYAMQLGMLRAVLASFLVASLPLEAQAQTRDIRVFADESLRAALAEANEFFLFENAMKTVMSYGASAELARQIETGAPGDVFISADAGAMDALAARNLIDTGTRTDLLSNKLVPPTLYPIAILSGSTNVLASIYVQYLTSPKAAPFFESHGFVFLP